MVMEAGTLRHKIVIEKSTHVSNSFNEQTETWVSFLETWAGLRSLTGGERVIASQTAAKENVVFKIRYAGGLSPKMRINKDGDIYEISSIQDLDARKRELTIYAYTTEV
jgi:SPP1 family predicted phage head-tail adaptor